MQLGDPRGKLESAVRQIAENNRKIEETFEVTATGAGVDALLAASGFLDTQELISASSASILGSTDRIIDSATLVLPSGWTSMDALLIGSCVVSNKVGTDQRVVVWLESPASTQLNQRRSVSLISTGAYADEPAAVPLTGRVVGLTANQAVRIMGVITDGTAGLGDADATFRHLMALCIRRA